MTVPQTRQLNDLEGWVFLRRRFLAKKQRLYLRLNGAVITVHQAINAPIDWDASLTDASIHLFPRRAAILVTLASGAKLYFQPQPREICQKWFRALHVASSRRFEHLYKLGEKIGEGAFASVHKATRIADNLIVAVKLIKKRQFDMQMARELQREMYTMKHVTHCGLISAHDIFNMPDKLLIVMDYMKGGTLKDNIQMNGAKLSESDALPIVRQVLEACAYLHSMGFVHRDLKLENVLCEQQEISNIRVRLADFGYVNFVSNPRDFCLRSLVGTPVYVAPEIIKRQQYGTPVDIYSIGVMLHRMLVGYYPFEGTDDEKTLALALRGNLHVEGKHWDNISLLCKNFVLALLSVDSEKRLTAVEALRHPWFQSTHLERLPERKQEAFAATSSDFPPIISPVTPDLPPLNGMTRVVYELESSTKKLLHTNESHKRSKTRSPNLRFVEEPCFVRK